MRKMTVKMKQVIDSILSNEYPTINDLSLELNMKKRQVRYYLDLINQYGNQIIINMDHKGGIHVKDINLLRDIGNNRDYTYNLSKEDRMKCIHILIAFRISELNLSFLSKVMSVNRTTVKNDLEAVKKQLLDYHLYLSYDKKFILHGNNTDIFKYRVSCIHRLFDFYELNNVYNLQQFEEIDLFRSDRRNEMHKLETWIIQYVSKFNDVVKGHRLINLSHAILTLLYYCKYDIDLPDIQDQLPGVYIKKYDDFIKLMEERCHIKFSDKQKVYFDSIISYMYNTIDNEEQKDIRNKTILFVYNLISFIESKTDYCLHEDIDLLNALYQHMMLTFTDKTNTYISLEFKDNFALSHEIETLIKDFCDQDQNDLDEQEILFIQFHIENALRNQRQSFKKQVLLVSSASKYVIEALCHDLERTYNINIVRQITSYELDIDIFQYDAILFTEDIPSYLRYYPQIVKINLTLTKEDYYKLDNIPFELKRHKIDMKQMEYALNFLNVEDKKKTLHIVKDFLKEENIGVYDYTNALSKFQISYLDDKEDIDYPIQVNEFVNIGFCIHNSEENSLDISTVNNQEYIVLKSKDVGLLIQGLLEISLKYHHL